jgi:hypothetical protein
MWDLNTLQRLNQQFEERLHEQNSKLRRELEKLTNNNQHVDATPDKERSHA